LIKTLDDVGASPAVTTIKFFEILFVRSDDWLNGTIKQYTEN